MKIIRFTHHAAVAVVLTSILAGCSATGVPGPDSDSTGSASGGSSGGLVVGSGGGKGEDNIKIDDQENKEEPPAEACGDGLVDEEHEACDDGNNNDGDGCWGNCLGVEKGFICRDPGQPCAEVARCGDLAVVFPEQCDDGALLSGDGCSATCKIELGFKCDAGQACVPTICGDDLIEGAEMCEPNLNEGCTSQCQFEPDCGDGTGACTSECGDGLVLGEECDDGNRLNGDGCDANCMVEVGYECGVEEGECERADNGECILRVPVIYRDFAEGGAFEVCPSAPETTQNGVVSALDTGKVKNDLIAGVPQPSSSDACWQVDDWYTDSSSSVKVYGEITLYENGKGGFVNRFGANGEKWVFYDNAEWAAATMAECEALVPAVDCIPCTWDEAVGCTGDTVEMDGNPFFFPVDGIAGALDAGGGSEKPGQAKLAPDYYHDNSWPWESEVNGGIQVIHNFHFTSEVKYWFPYDQNTNATLEFLGDDDVWVFVNGRLAVDLGGIHIPQTGAVTINAQTAQSFGLAAGNVYEIKVFHAERKAEGSSFKLTLSGFNARRSDCIPECGDGYIGVGEECDDGADNVDPASPDAYNRCGTDCRLGAFCGDGIKQDNETCDDNDPNAPASCNGCNDIVIVVK